MAPHFVGCDRGRYFLIWTSKLWWYMELGLWLTLGVQKNMCFNEIGLFAQKIIYTALGLFVNTSERAYVIT